MTLPFWPEGIPPGTRIGAYTIRAKLGMGGTGVVYEARSPNGHLFALKVARQRRAVLDAPASVDELRRDRSIICHGLLKGHPNVVELYGYERHPDSLSGWSYQVLELVPGSRTITQWARERNPSLNEITWVFQQLAKLLGDMHSQGIRHRDIKPSNILMTPGGVPKLVDFGSASYVHAQTVTFNAAWAQPGTRGYLAPELCSEIVTERATWQFKPFTYEPSGDLHALGVVFYEVLTGRHPFEVGLEGESLLWHIANYMPTPPRVHNPGVPAGLEGIVMMLLRKDPRIRHKGGYLLARELELERTHAPPEIWSVPFRVPAAETMDGHPSRTSTDVLTEPGDAPVAAPRPATALVRIERWPPPARRGASPRHQRPHGRRLVGYVVMAGLILAVAMVSRRSWPAASDPQKGADVPRPATTLTTTKMLTALVCASVGGCAHVKVREADRDWLAQCSAKSREAVRTLPVPQGHNTMATLLEGENVRYLPGTGVEVKPGPIKAEAHLGLKQAALLHGEVRVGEDGVSMQFTKLTIGDESGDPWVDGPWPAGKEFHICAIAFDEGAFGTIGPGLPVAERRTGSVIIRSMHIDLRVAR